MQVFAITKDIDLLSKDDFTANVKRFLGATELVFVVPDILVQAFQAAYKSRAFCRVVSERLILPLSLEDIQTWDVSGFPKRAGWYYQQLLKLAIAQTELAKPFFLIWDADTIPYRHMSFFHNGRMLFSEGPEYHIPYFKTNSALIGVDRTKEPVRFSTISQHMPVCRELMLNLLQHLGRDHAGDWIAAIRRSISDGRSEKSLFSEYELFADWVRLTQPDKFALRRIAWSRDGNLYNRKQLLLAKRVFNFIAYESWHEGEIVTTEIRRRLWKDLLLTSLQSKQRVVTSSTRENHSGRPSRGELFDKIYRDRVWGSTDQLSGGGSYGQWAAGYHLCVSEFIRREKVHSLLDIGCGDFSVGLAIAPLLRKYEAVDVSSLIINRNRELYGGLANVEFRVLDACTERLPRVDVVTIRQVFQHLTNAEIEMILSNVERSGARAAIIAEEVPRRKCRPNIDLPHSSNFTRCDAKGKSGVFIDKPPFARKATKVLTVPGISGRDTVLVVWVLRLQGAQRN